MLNSFQQNNPFHASRWLALIAIVLCPLVSVAGIMVQGTLRAASNASAQSFSGTLVAADDQLLTIAPDPMDQRQVRQISIEAIESLNWSNTGTLSPQQAIAEIARAESIWAHFDPPSFERVLIALDALMDDADWQNAYFVATRLLEQSVSQEHRLRAQILSAWSLLEMGMLTASESRLREAIRSVPTIQAPLRLCWLAARVAIKSGDSEGARRWAALPFLQIPTASGPLADDLRALGL